MNRRQYLLGKLAEEASEVAQIALKSQQFGMDERYHKLLVDNKGRIGEELDDLMSIIDLLNEEGLHYYPNISKQEEKKLKVAHYYEYSKSIGEVVE